MKMFISRKHTATHTLSLIASLALAFTSCVQLGEEQEGAYGYLTISGFDVDVQVEQLLPTKEGETVDILTVPGYFAPTLSSVTVTSTSDKDKSYTWKNEDVSLKLPADTYTLSATSGENDFGKSYYIGTGTVTVEAGKEVTGTVEFSLGNSVMKVTNGMTEHFTVTDGTTVTISSGDKSLQTTMTENVTGYVFVPSDKKLKVEVMGQSAAGVPTKFSQDVLGTATTAGKAYNVVITAEGAVLPEIKLKTTDLLAWGDRIFIIGDVEVDGYMSSDNIDKVVYEAIPVSSNNDWSSSIKAENDVIKGLKTGQEYKVRARIGGLTSDSITLTPSVTGLSTTVCHTDTNGDADGGDLDGTDVKTIFKSPHINVTALEPKWSFALYKKADVENNQVKENATPLRTYKDMNSDGSSITAANGWPYLPQGDYILVATATLKDEATVSSMEPIKVPEPEFTVTVSAYTSYDKYLEGDLNSETGANNCNPETLYNAGAKWGISTRLMANENYAKTLVIDIDGNEYKKINEKSFGDNKYYEDISGLSWASHSLAISFTFDGVTVKKQQTHHITGLPFSQDLRSNQDMTLWHIDGDTKFDNDRGLQIAYVWATDRSRDYTKVYSPAFQFPNDTNTSVNYEIGAVFYTSGAYSHTEQIYSGIVQGVESYSQTNKDNISVSKSYGKKISQYNHSGVMTKDSRVSIYHNEWYISGEFFQPQYWMHVATLSVKYVEK